jgi:4-hydroxy-2-oxoheptanedioate aldolase
VGALRNNALKASLASGGWAVGLMMTVADPLVAEIVGAANFDFVMIDMEHSPISTSQLQTMLIAVRPTTATCLVRPPANDVTWIKQVLDAGAEGLVVPHVSNAEECRRAVAAAKYPPDGNRGFGPRRVARLDGERNDYIARANDEVIVLVMIESAEGVANVAEIAATPGLAGIMIGVGDLSMSMGHATDPEHPSVVAAVDEVVEHCVRHHVPFGMFPMDAARTDSWLRRGCQVAVMGSDIGFIDLGIAKMQADLATMREGTD